ncbi:MAG: cation diffusion facilitator family transporter [Phycisphaeraceae bacterium]
MPEPDANPDADRVLVVARWALVAGVGITLVKFLIFAMTNSIAVLTDAFESIINIAAAGVMLYSVWYANRPADRRHHYGHGKIEFMAVGLEGWLILLAAGFIAVEGVRRIFTGPELERLTVGSWLLGGVAIASGLLAGYIWRAGVRYGNDVLIADGKHLATDVVSTLGVIVGLLLVRWTGYNRLDAVIAILLAIVILATSWRLLWHSFHGLMDRSEPEDESAVRAILDGAVAADRIAGYHKLRQRRSGGFHWVDVHLHVPGDMTVRESHALASEIEHAIELRLGRANATAHVEPAEDRREAEAEPPSPSESPPPAPAPTEPTEPIELAPARDEAAGADDASPHP